jgi:hypothetical protein
MAPSEPLYTPAKPSPVASEPVDPVSGFVPEVDPVNGLLMVGFVHEAVTDIRNAPHGEKLRTAGRWSAIFATGWAISSVVARTLGAGAASLLIAVQIPSDEDVRPRHFLGDRPLGEATGRGLPGQ